MKLKSGVEVQLQRLALTKYDINYKEKGSRWNTLGITLRLGKKTRNIMMPRKEWKNLKHEVKALIFEMTK